MIKEILIRFFWAFVGFAIHAFLVAGKSEDE